MLRISTLPALLFCCLAASTGAAAAQQKPPEQPPRLDVIEPGSDVPAVIAPRAGTKITEKKEGGVVTEVKVKSGKSSYTMKPNVPAGNAQPGDAVSSQIRAPQWTVMEFDLLKKKKTQPAGTAETVNAPPPAMAKPAAAPPVK